MIKLTDILQEIIEEKKADRCKRIADRKYSKPSAYKSGAIVRCRKGKIWKDIKESEIDSLTEATLEEKKETLRTWFKRKGAPGKVGGWVDCNTCRNGKCKPCGRKKGEVRAKYPSCRPTPAQCKRPGKGKTWGKTKENLNETRQGFLNYLQQQLPNTPEHVIRDMIYRDLQSMIKKSASKEEMKGLINHFKDIKWELKTNFPITMDIFSDKTKEELKRRIGGEIKTSVPKDAERLQTQQNLLQKQGISKEPIILFKTKNNKYDLAEGWHRTIQNFKSYPEGFIQPNAYVGLNAPWLNENWLKKQIDKYKYNRRLKNNRKQEEKRVKKEEKEIADALKQYNSKIQSELSKNGLNRLGIIKSIEPYKEAFIKKYGGDLQTNKEDGYIRYLTLIDYYKRGDVDTKKFLSYFLNDKFPSLTFKPVYGSGRYHNIYQSAKYPDILIKAEEFTDYGNDVNTWFNLFKQHPEVFVKVFRIIKFKNAQGELKDAVVMEKVNTKPFEELWDKIEDTYKKLLSSDDNFKTFYDTKVKGLNVGTPQSLQQFITPRNIRTSAGVNDSKFIEKKNELFQAAKKQHPSLSNKIDEFDKLYNQVTKINRSADIHRWNLGYDKSGKLKMFDI